VSITGWVRSISLLQTPRSYLETTNPLIQWTEKFLFPGVRLTTLFHLELKLRMSGAISLLSCTLYDVDRSNFTFTFYKINIYLYFTVGFIQNSFNSPSKHLYTWVTCLCVTMYTSWSASLTAMTQVAYLPRELLQSRKEQSAVSVWKWQLIAPEPLFVLALTLYRACFSHTKC
jgi:hypothetical protein